jgi:hypothetical protein
MAFCFNFVRRFSSIGGWKATVEINPREGRA